MSITKLYAGVVGDPLNTSGPQLAASVNDLIDAHVSHIKALPVVANARTGTVYRVISFYNNLAGGGGSFIYDHTKDQSFHNGGTVIAPPALLAWNGNQSDITTLLDWTGSGMGCWVRIIQDSLTPLMFGAVADDNIDNAASMIQCIITSATLKIPTEGNDVLFGVSGDLFFDSIANINIRNLRLKQLTPDNSSRRTIHLLNCDYIRLNNVVVDRNGLGNQGGLNSAGGVWITGGSEHVCENIEVFGDGKGNGIAIINTTNAEYKYLYAHNISYDQPSATDDLVQGIWCYLNNNCTFEDFTVTNLLGNATSQPVNRFTRGIAFAGNVDCSLLNPHVSEVDQGIDVSGSDGNINCQINGGIVKSCDTWGVKLANSAVGITVSGVHANNCGLSGFVASGPSNPSLPNKTMDCRFVNCVATNCGDGTVAGTKAGFQVLTGTYDTDYPKGIKFIDCQAIDNQLVKTMTLGFRNEVSYDGTSGKTNELVNCRSVGHTSAVSTGFHAYTCRLYGTTNQSLVNATETNIDWNAEVFDTTGMHSLTSNLDNMNPSINGRWRISFNVVFESNSTGHRRVKVLLSGASVIGGEFIEPAVNGAETTVSGEVELIAHTANTFRLAAYQNSGSGLNVNRAKSHFTATLIEVQ